jgi:CRISPR-associated protein Csd1
MLLEKLSEYAGRVEIAPPMYQETPIRWLIELDPQGNFLNFVPTSSGAEGKRDRGKRFPAPHIGKSSGIRAKLLTENLEYVLGVPRPGTAGSKLRKVQERHHAFVEEVRRCAEATREPAVQAVLKFLQNWDPRSARLPADLNPADLLTFRVGGVCPIELDSVREHWARVASPTARSRKGKKKAPRQMQCLICGELKPALERQEFKIKRVPGGQTSGVALISANQEAFESYGLEHSLIAPTCERCGERFSKALQTLLRDETTHIALPRCAYIFWTKEETDFNPALLLTQPSPDEVKLLLQTPWSAKERHVGLGDSPYYAAALSGNGGRLVVRDWLETTVRNARESLRKWFRKQHLVGEWGELWGQPNAWPLPLQGYWRGDGQSARWVDGLAECVAPKVKKRRDPARVSPNVAPVLLRAALLGQPLPGWLLHQAVERNRAEQDVTRTRAALIKMVFVSESPNPESEDPMTELDQQNHDPAYVCGRLLAILESIQRQALGDIGSTIIDRFFGTASSAPASVFGTLLRGSQAHLAKLRKTRPAAWAALQQRLEEVAAPLKRLPRVLTLQEQGLFALGYYHQRAADRARAKARKAARETETPDGPAPSGETTE